MKYPILLPNIFNYPFTYESEIILNIGDFVQVPFGKSKLTGVVWNDFEKKNNKIFKIKKVIKKFDTSPLKINTINFLNWFSEYNLIPKGMALKLTLLENSIVEKSKDERFQKYSEELERKVFELSKEQSNSLKLMNKLNDKFRVHVLQGTTGSGKTIVYFEALRAVIEKGFQGLILLPEIGLTSQFEQKFYEFFGFKPAIWHSRVSKKIKN